ncbi:MAG TPA: hypothetical protein VGH37_15145 [Candidatus Acidoferrum sp.]
MPCAATSPTAPTETSTLTLLQFALWALFGVSSAPARPTSAATCSVASFPAAQNQTTRNPHGPINIPCENCHTSAGWRPIRVVPEFDHNKTKYPLRGMHEKVKCVQCHIQPVFTNVGKNCADCHADIHRRQMGSDCAQCHTVKGWNIATKQVLDHQNRFPLLGAHAAVPCDSCHKSAAVGQFLGLQTQCDSCHLKDWQNTTNPPHQSAGPLFASGRCDQCHGFDSWLGAKFDHSSTGFQLTNGHANLACSACHINNNYNLTSGACQNCHLTQWQQTNNPTHASAGPAFAAANCAGCHNTISWTTAIFDHSSTGFPLTNGHANVPCASCHVNNNYNLTSGACQNCHLTQWQKTTNPPHASAGSAFAAANCTSCHNTISWTTAIFDHSTTGFLLTNGHANVPCASCHINNNYNLQIAPTDCGNSGCHLTTWQQTTTPVHSTSGAAFGASNCANCHTTKGWDAASFDHSITGFTLVGTHMSPTPTPCASCHVNNNYSLNSADCLSCHTPDWNKTQTLGGNVPNHVAANFPTSASACATCHTITSWANGVFDHSSTGFPLTNSHQMSPAGKVTACTQCHINSNYNLSIQPADCGNSGCHLTTWQQTNNPTHPSAGSAFAVANCSTCHDTIAWTDISSFNHATTGFALTGTHMSPTPTACVACHVNNNYTLSSTDCMSCHQASWQSTQTLGGNVPNHVAAGFPTTAAACSTCHTITTWANGVFDHTTTGFPLTNSHQLAPAGKVPNCSACHINGNYNLTIQPNDCGNAGCHLTTWQQTNNPTHSTSGAPFAVANCSTCHNTITWTTATFNHSATGWPLTGAHANTPCANCHVNNNYNFTTANTDCYGCHQTQWNSTATMGGAVPNHAAAGFPTSQCSTCHTTTNWTSTWSHNSTGFPLQNLHQFTSAGGKINACTDCHISNNYNLQIAPTACGTSGCHLTTWQQTNNPTHSTAGAAFALANCANCHTTLGWGTANFDHSTTGFPLTGAHVTTACTLCHVNNNYNLTAANTDCYGCHASTWTSTATMGGGVPNHVAAGFPTSLCSTCHNTTAWKPGTFDHSTTGWALTGAHLTTACNLCHVNNNYTFTAANTTCYGCHTADWNSTQTLGGAVPNHIAAGYPTTCDTCHTTTSWLGATFNHTYFPIPHHKSVCNDCHQVATNYASFTCINCHTQTAHQQTQTNQTHTDVNGYSYGPTTCYNCHQNGGGG